MKRTNPWGTWFVLASLFLAASPLRAAEFADDDAGAVETAPVPAAAAAVAPALAVSAQAGFAQSAASVDAVVRNLHAALAAAQNAQAPLPDTAPGAALPSTSGLPVVYFAEETDVSQKIVASLDPTTQSFCSEMHGCSLDNVVDSIQRAAQRGVKVRIIMEGSYVFPNVKRGEHLTPQVQRLVDLSNAGTIEMRTLRGIKVPGAPYGGVQHRKSGLYDGQSASVGSFNFTAAANNQNWENLIFLNDPDVLQFIQDRFEEAWDLAKPLSFGDPGFLSPGFTLSKSASDATVTFHGQPYPKIMASPNGGIAAKLAQAHESAQTSIHKLMFSFYDTTIARELVEKSRAGLDVRVVLEKTQAQHSAAAKYLFDNGVKVMFAPPRDPSNPGVLHDKTTIYDGQMVSDGSFNETVNADQHNFEYLLFLTDPSLISRFEGEFEKIWAQGVQPQAADFHVSQQGNGGDTSQGDGQK